MGKNLKYQLLNAIDRGFKPGMDKHSQKANGEKGSKICDYHSRKNLIDVSAQMANFIKDNYQEVKMIKDVTGDIIQEFLNSKASTCAASTLGQYKSRIHTIEQMINKCYKDADVVWHEELISPISKVSQDKIRNISFDKKDLGKILENAENKNSQSKAVIAIELARRFGLRVCETVKLQPRDIHLDKLELHVHESKGKRSRDIAIRDRDIPFLKKIVEGLENDKPIVQIKEDSVNKYLVRAEEELGIREKYKDADTGIHAIRKMVAQELYDEYRNEGHDKRETLDMVSEYLGHGKNRDECMKAYILKIW